ncbi:MAG: secondary thiamine-phosphate synthase enzyme [Candidatus Altiarchaeales archaeon ex4484_2]|nr:MAG: secondary thiamine-phosphate synthase enzyme [Candidatus Altiarchaeales archaeon ex4484_2]
MAVKTEKFMVRISADGGMADITGQVEEKVKGSGLGKGTVTVFIPGATGSVSTIEYEPGLLKDFPRAMERIAPAGIDYEHHKTWGDDNGRSHVRATLMGPSLVVPFVDGKLMLGTWQQITAVNFDTREREREIILQIMGE